MARRAESNRPTRKHFARAQREEILRRWILIGAAVLAVAVVVLIGYGWYDVNVVQANEVILSVNGDEVLTEEFRGRVRLIQLDLSNQFYSNAQLLDAFVDNPEIQANISLQLEQIRAQNDNEAIIGQSAVDEMLEDLIIRQEAERRGLTVSEEDLSRSIAEAFGYFADGTPTPVVTPQPTATIELDVDITPQPTIVPTQYTEALYVQRYNDYLDDPLNTFDITEEDFRQRLLARTYASLLFGEFAAELPTLQDQVNARHILVEDEETANDLMERLDAGESWDILVTEFSQDPGSTQNNGELGWFGRGRMIIEFEEAAFSAEVGEVVGPVETSFGWHIIEVVDRDERPVSEQEIETLAQQALREFIEERKLEDEIVINAIWIDRVPTSPVLPNLAPILPVETP